MRRALLRPGEEFEWVNDQIAAAAKPGSEGQGRRGEVSSLRHPEGHRHAPRLEQDPVSGVAAVGFAANRSKVEQRKLVIFAVARKAAESWPPAGRR